MKCEKCLKNDATFHSVSNINGKVSEKHLCSECAKHEKDFEKLGGDFFDFNKKSRSYFDDLVGSFNSTLSYFSNPLLDSFFDFDNFFDTPLLLESNPFYEFGENQPKTEKNNFQNNVKQSDKANEKLSKLSEEEKKKLEIAKLDLALKKAVVEERYEDAIKLRDKIKELKNQK